MLGISERIEDTLNELEFRVVGSSIQKGEYVTEVQFYSDAGDDYIMTAARKASTTYGSLNFIFPN